jgi:hypothetical protein
MEKNMFKKIVSVLALGLSLSACGQLNKETHTFTVDSKERKCDSAGETTDCYYVVYGTGGEVFENRDDLLNAKFNSGTLQAKFKVGSTYTVRTTGWRNEFLSMQPNIIEVKFVK